MKLVKSKIKKHFQSNFSPSPHALKVLIEGKIIAESEKPSHMIERVVNSLVEVEKRFNTSPKEIKELAKKLIFLLDNKYCVMSTPILTNAGRYIQKPLSACSMPPLDLVHDSKEKIKKVIFKFHQDGMGTGFNLNELDDPVSILKMLNNFAIESADSGKENRPVGNMATLTVYHSDILKFINTKTKADKLNEIWKFNISVDCDKFFFQQLLKNRSITLKNGKTISAEKIFNSIQNAAYSSADPGLIFLDRMEEDNPTPNVGHYESTAPCAEVGLTKGESCQFGYINLGRFINKNRNIDLVLLKDTVYILTRMLDNALEISIDNYSELMNKEIMIQKRKIGIGICGLADFFVKLKINYASLEARELAKDIIAFINYESKIVSHELAKVRSSAGAFSVPIGNRYFDTPSFLEKKYGELNTKYVSCEQWKVLSQTIRKTKLLRNVSTIALPPTGRSGLIVDASTGVEPIFSREEYMTLHKNLKEYEPYIKTAKEILPEDHLLMVASIQKVVDESISKTINLPFNIKKEEIRNIYLRAWQLGLKGVSIYRENSKKKQPRKL